MAEPTSSTDQLEGTTSDPSPSTEKKPIPDTPGKTIFKEFLNQVHSSPDQLSKDQIANDLSKKYGSVQNFDQAVDKLYQSQFDVENQDDMGRYVRGFIDDFDKTISGQVEITNEAPEEDVSPAPEEDTPQDGPAPIPDTPGKAVFKEFLNQVHASPDEISKDQIKQGLRNEFGNIDSLDQATEKLYQSQFDVENQDDIGGYVRSFIEDFDNTLSGKEGKKKEEKEKPAETGIPKGAVPASEIEQRVDQFLLNSTSVANIRPVGRKNKDGSESTVLMESAGNFAYPTLFPKDPNNVTSNPNDWVELEGEQAFQEAQRRGEVFEFGNEEDAQKFAEGAWKNPQGELARLGIPDGRQRLTEILYDENGNLNENVRGWNVVPTEESRLMSPFDAYKNAVYLDPERVSGGKLIPEEDVATESFESSQEKTGKILRESIAKNTRELDASMDDLVIDRFTPEEFDKINPEFGDQLILNTLNNPDGRLLPEDFDIENFKGFFGEDAEFYQNNYVAAQNRAAARHLAKIGNENQQRFFEDILQYSANGDRERAQLIYDSRVNEIAENYLSPDDLKILSKQEEISEIEKIPIDQRTTQQRIQLKERKAELEELTTGRQLYDPTTGRFISKTDELPKGKKGQIQAFNDLMNQYEVEYEKTDLGVLKKKRDQLLFKYKAFTEDFAIPHMDVGFMDQRNVRYVNSAGKEIEAPLLDVNNENADNVDAFAIVTAEDTENPGKTREYKIDLSTRRARMAHQGNFNPDNTTADYNNRIEGKKAELLAEFMAINRVIELNLDPGTTEESGFFGSIGEGFADALGVSTSQSALDDKAVNIMKEAGVNLTPEQKDRIDKTIWQKAGRATGESLPISLEIGTNLFIGNKIAGAAKIGKVAKALSNGNKAREFGLTLVGDAAMQGTAFSMSGQGFTTGVGESIGQNLAGAMLKRYGINNRILRFGGKLIGGTTTETVAEFSGEFLGELKDNGFNWDEAVRTTFGKDAETFGEKLAITAMVAGTMGLPGSSIESAFVMEEISKKVREEGDQNSPIVQAFLKHDFTTPPTGQEIARAEEIKKKVLNNEEITEEDVLAVELVADKQAFQKKKLTMSEERSPIVLQKQGGKTEYKTKKGTEDGFKTITEEELLEKLDVDQFVDKIKRGEEDLDVVNPSPEVEKKIFERFPDNSNVERVKLPTDVDEVDPATGQAKIPFEGEPVQGELGLEAQPEKKIISKDDKDADIEAEEVITVFNASTRPVEELGERSGVVYMATDKREADAFAESNRGEVREFNIKQSDIADESVILNEINELGLTPENENISVDEALTYELIDSRFDNSLSEEDIKTLFESLKNKGIKAIRYTDGAQVVGGTTESIAIIDNDVLSQPETEESVAEAIPIVSEEEVETVEENVVEPANVKIDQKANKENVAKASEEIKAEEKLDVIVAENHNEAGIFSDAIVEPIPKDSKETHKRVGVPSVRNLIGIGQKMDKNNTGWKIGKKRAIIDGRAVVDVITDDGDVFYMYRSTGEGSGTESTGKWTPVLNFDMNGFFVKYAFDPSTGEIILDSRAREERFNPKLNKYGVESFNTIAEFLEKNENEVFTKDVFAEKAKADVVAETEVEQKTETDEIAKTEDKTEAVQAEEVEAQAPLVPTGVAEPQVQKGVSVKLEKNKLFDKAREKVDKKTRKKTGKKIGGRSLRTDSKKKLLSVTPSSPRQAILQFFLGGGRVSREEMSTRVSTGKKDLNLKHTLTANKSQGASGIEDQIPATLREKNKSLFEGMDDQEISNMVLDVLDEHETLGDIAEELHSDNSIGDVLFLNQSDKIQFESNQKIQEEFEAEVTELAEEFEEIVSDETVLEMEADQKIKEEQEFNEYIDSLTDEQITEEFGKPVEKTAEKPVSRPEGKVEPGKEGKEQKIKEATKQLADKIRSKKVDFGGLDKLSTSPAPIFQAAINSGIETIATTIQAGGTIAQAVADAIKTIKESDWYKNLSEEAKAEADKKLEGPMKEYAEEAKKQQESKEPAKKKSSPEPEKQAKKEAKERKKAEENRQPQSSVAQRRAKMMKDKGEAQKVLDRTTYQKWSLEEGGKKIDQLYEDLASMSDGYDTVWEAAIGYVNDPLNKVHPALKRGVKLDAAAKLMDEGERVGGAKGQEMMEMGLSILEAESLESTKDGQANAMIAEIYKRHPKMFWRKKIDKAVNIKREQALNSKVADGSTVREAIGEAKDALKQEMADMKAELEGVITELEQKLKDAKKSTKRTESIASQKKRANDMISSGLSKLKGTRGQANSGIDPTIIEGVAEIVGGLLLKGFSNTRSIINKTYNLIRGAGIKNLTKENIENIANTIDEFKSAKKMEQVQTVYNKIQKILNTEREVNASTIDEMVENANPIWEQYQKNILSKVQARVNQLAGSSRVRQSKAELEKLSNKIAKEIGAMIAEIQSDVQKRTTEKTSARETFIDLMANSDKIQEVYNRILSDPSVDVKTKNEILNLLDQEVVVSNTLINNLISEQAGVSGKTVAQVAEMHYSGKENFVGTLAESLVRDAGLSVDEAIFVGNYLTKKMRKAIKEKARKSLEKFLAKTINAEDIKHAIETGNITPEIQKEIDRRLKTSDNRKLIRRVTKAVNLGALESPAFYDAFAKKFGFRTIDPYTAAKFNQLVNEIEELRAQENTVEKVQIQGKSISKTEFDKFPRERVLDLERELNTLLDTVDRASFNFYADNLIAIKYMGVLSGISTQIRALSGAIFGLGVNVPAFGARNIMSLRGVILGIMNGVRAGRAASARAKLARKGGVVEIGAGIGGFERLASQRTQGASQAKLTAFERQMLKGFEKATKQLKGKRYGVAALNYMATTVLQPFRMFHLLSASDAFFSTAFAEMVVTTEMYNKQAKELGLNPLQTFTGMGTRRNTNGGVTNASLIERVQESLSNDAQSKEAFDKIAENEYNQIEDKIREELRKEGYSGAKLEREATKRLRKKIGGTSKFLTPKKAYKARRRQELKENQNLERFEYAIGMVKDWLLIGTPDGIMGGVAKGVQKGLSIKPEENLGWGIAKLIGNWQIMFLRLSANSFNQIKTGIPIFGMVDAVVGFGVDPVTGEIQSGKGVKEATKNFLTSKVKYDPQRAYQRLMVASMSTTAAVAIFMDMFDWDEDEEDFVLDPDRAIDILGPGHFSNVKNLQKIEDYQKFSFSFTKDGKGEFDRYIKTNLSPYAQGITAFISAYSDDLRGLDDEADIRRRKGALIEKSIIGTVSNPFQAWWEGSFNSMGRLIRASQAEDDAWAGLQAIGEQIVLDNTKAIVQPAAYRDAIRFVQKQTGAKKKQATTLTEKFLNGFYGLDFMLEEKKDMFGNTYPVTDAIDEWITGHEKMSEKHKEVGLLYKFDQGLEINPWRPSNMERGERFNLDGVEVEALEDGVGEAIMKRQQELFKEYVLSDFDYFNSIEDRSELEWEMTQTKNAATADAKFELFDELLNKGLIKIVQ